MKSGITWNTMKRVSAMFPKSSRGRDIPSKIRQAFRRHLEALFSCSCEQRKNSIIRPTYKVSIWPTTPYFFLSKPYIKT